MKTYTDEEKEEIATNMINYGGSFVARLGEALLYADNINSEKIYIAFPEYCDEYLYKTKVLFEGVYKIPAEVNYPTTENSDMNIYCAEKGIKYTNTNKLRQFHFRAKTEADMRCLVFKFGLRLIEEKV